jgi:hypothetical protein
MCLISVFGVYVDMFVYFDQKRNCEEVDDNIFLNRFSLPHFGCDDDNLKIGDLILRSVSNNS